MSNNQSTGQVQITEEMRSTWAAQIAPMSKATLDAYITSLVLKLDSGKVPAGMVDGAREMLAFARDALAAK